MTSFHLRLLIGIVLGLVLTIVPLPALLLGVRPPWILLLVLYLQFYLPDYFNAVILLIIGLIMDVLLSTVLGEHVFALSLVTWIASSKARRFPLFSIGQQMGLVGCFCLFYQIIILVIDASLGYRIEFIMVFTSTIISILFWPWVRLLADEILVVKAKTVYRH